MLSQVYDNIYCNKIPLPQNPLKSLNCYIITSTERNLIIDTGFNQPECENAFMNGIQELNLDLAKTDLFLTHRHSDHTGLAYLLEEKGVRVFAGAHECTAIHEAGSQQAMNKFGHFSDLYGLGEYDITANDNPGYRYRPGSAPHCQPMAEGDTMEYGEYVFSIVNIPGHTPGHVGLYEAKRKLFFCGDHILASITPNITFWGFEQDSLAQYLESLAKVYDMDIDWLFCAHRTISRDHKTRIQELKAHHSKRLVEVMQLLSGERKTVGQVAAKMTWSIRAKSWEDFPKAQKWFASGEAAAHLEYLFNAGKIMRTQENGVLYYCLK